MFNENIEEYVLLNSKDIKTIYEGLVNAEEVDVDDYKDDRYIKFQFINGLVGTDQFKGILMVSINRDGYASVNGNVLNVSKELFDFIKSIENRDSVNLVLTNDNIEKVEIEEKTLDDSN
jgi:hypothetical protein